MKLSKRQRTALEKSIVKWELIVIGEGEDRGCGNCELCHLYTDNFCNSCPVMLTTGQDDCSNSPWKPWQQYQAENGKEDGPLSRNMKVFDEKSKELAQAELDFLRGILAEAP